MAGTLPLALPLGVHRRARRLLRCSRHPGEPPAPARRVLGAAVALAPGTPLRPRCIRRGRTLSLEYLARKQHWVQAMAQGSVLLYWGWYWPEVYDSAHLLAAQLLFAYAFDMLLSWSRRDELHAGLRAGAGRLQHQPVSLVQTGLVLSAVRARRARLRGQGADPLDQERSARSHIFNPSSFPLAVFSVGLLATGQQRPDLGPRDREHAVLSAAHVSDAVPRSALPGQLLFGVTTMTHVGGGLDLPLRPGVLRGHRRLLLLRFVHPDCRLPRHAPAVHRSVHVAADRSGPGHLRRALRAEHRGAVLRCWAWPACRRSTTSCCRYRCSTCRSRASTRAPARRPLQALDPDAAARGAGAAHAPSRLRVRVGASSSPG